MMKLRTWRWGDYTGLSEWTLNAYYPSERGAEGNFTHTHTHTEGDETAEQREISWPQ